MLLILLIMFLLALMQLPSLVNQKQWGELAAFAVLWLFATAYALLIGADVPVPNPTEVIRAIFTWFYDLVGLNVTI
jgi:hypothetical protein